jgi:hemoglobin/transferrin/lactoferrin receptor protein
VDSGWTDNSLRKLYFLLLLTSWYTSLDTLAQEITVVDQSTFRPVEGAMVINQQQSISLATNQQGQASLAGFEANEPITISHPSYESYFTTAELVKTSNYQIQLTQKIILIDEVVIAANRWEQEKKQTPNRIVSIGPREIAFSNPQTSADMLAETNQVFVQKSQMGGGSPMIRGFAANSVLIVVDGVRMNNAIFRSGNLQNVISLDPLALENTEVLFGPGSVMYGSDALGGVMHFRTRSPKFSTDDKSVFEANSLLRYASANQEKTAHVDFSLRAKKITNFTSFTFSDYHHLKTGNNRTSKFPNYGKRFEYVDRINNEDQVVVNPDFNEQIFSGYHQLNFLNKTRFKIGNTSELIYALNYSTTSDIPRYDRLIETNDDGELKAAEWFYGPQKWLSNSLQFNVYQQKRLYDAARFILTLQNVKESRNDRNFGDALLRTRTDKVDVWTANFDLEKKLDQKHLLFYGLEWFYNQVTSTAVRRDPESSLTIPATSRYPEGGSEYAGLAAYVSHKYHPNQKVAVTTGIRYNLIWLEATYSNIYSPGNPTETFQVDNSAVNGSLGVAWLPGSNWQLNGLFSTGFRAPNIDDVGKIFNGSNGIVTVPNASLRPEYSYNLEIGLNKSVRDKLNIAVTGYYTFLDNAIVQDNFTYQGFDSIFFDGEISKVQALVNTSSGKIYGGNIQMEYAILSNLGLKASYTITQGEDSENRPLRHTTPDFGFMAVDYRFKQFRGELSYRFSGKRSFEDLPLSEQQKTHLYTSDGSLAWQTLNFRSAYHINKNFTVTAGVENIFDQHYRPYSSGISAPGRNFIFSVKASL